MCLSCLPCSLIPFCTKSCRDVKHCCSNCHKVLYVYSKQDLQHRNRHTNNLIHKLRYILIMYAYTSGVIQQRFIVQQQAHPAIIQSSATPTVIQAPKPAMVLQAGASTVVYQQAPQPAVVMQPAVQPAVQVVQPQVMTRVIQSVAQPGVTVYQSPPGGVVYSRYY
ncbi:hypothetical protein MHYP_G00099510 [Metynnis hypsauchen]